MFVSLAVRTRSRAQTSISLHDLSFMAIHSLIFRKSFRYKNKFISFKFYLKCNSNDIYEYFQIFNKF